MLAVLRQMLPVPLVTASRDADVTCMAQPDKRRAIAHLLHYIPEKRTLAATRSRRHPAVQREAAVRTSGGQSTWPRKYGAGVQYRDPYRK